MQLGDLDEEIGEEVWPCARVLLRWLDGAPAAGAPVLRGLTALELGAGTGFLACGLVSSDREAEGAGLAKVYATDGNASTVENMRLNIDANRCAAAVVPLLWDWEATLRPPPAVSLDEVDVILGSDIVYTGAGEAALAGALASLLRDPQVSQRRTELRALLALCDRPAPALPEALRRVSCGGEEATAKRQRCAATAEETAVGRFLRACEERSLVARELELPRALVAEVLWEGAELDGGDGSGGPLRLFELRVAPCAA